MISTFNMTKLNSLLRDFYTLTRIRITIFDETFNELAAYPEHIAPFCELIRTDPLAKAACRRCDALACQTASCRHTPYVYRCHAGLTEAISPIYMGNIVIGYLLFGHILAYPSHQEGWANIYPLCCNYQIDLEKLHEACLERPLITEDYILSASHILQAVASYLCMERMVTLRQKNLPVQIDEFIMQHYTEDIDVKSLCEHFNIGKTTLYELASQNYGMGIAEHIRHLRIEKAKNLLLDYLDLTISEVASACGFSDYNYFITTFKREVGLPPKKYRKTEG